MCPFLHLKQNLTQFRFSDKLAGNFRMSAACMFLPTRTPATNIEPSERDAENFTPMHYNFETTAGIHTSLSFSFLFIKCFHLSLLAASGQSVRVSLNKQTETSQKQIIVPGIEAALASCPYLGNFASSVTARVFSSGASSLTSPSGIFLIPS